MSVYRRDGAKTYSYDFRWRGHRFSGSTGETDKRRAEAWEKAERQRVKTTAIDLTKPMTFGVATTMYWTEIGQFHRNAVDTERSLAWLQKHVGISAALLSITDQKVSALVTKRRLEGVSNATVNRSVIEPLRGVMRAAVERWGQRVDSPPKWKLHTLKEAQERIREMSADEEARYFAALRPDYHPIIKFALLSGCRMQEILDIEWRHIDWRSRSITVTGKGDKTRTIPLTNGIEAILKPLPRAFKEHVFTYEVQRASGGARGEPKPIMREGLKITHARTCKKAGLEDFRFHDFRHTAATRLLRQTGNLRLVQLLLGHEDVKTTMRYAHASGNDLLNAMNATENATIAANALDKSMKIKDN